ncbi:MAG: C4-type zinc ribbon domain-containing protein [Candidatus Aadella gelida]|nr:C4-type zinc ribbon domain-containing protein [Candidatus Aadella gelida]
MTEKTDIREDIEKLIKIKSIDVRIYEMKSRKDTFPVRIKEMDDSLGSKRSGLEEAEENLKQAKVEKNDRENDLREKEEKIKKHQGELNLIKKNKEYTALQQEIESLKADASLLEEEIIGLLDEIESAEAKKKKEEGIFAAEGDSVESEKSAIVKEEKELLEMLKGLGAEREEMTASIDSKILDVYERILANKGQTALAVVNGESCSECNMHLRPQIINDAKLQKTIVLCENCGRMLYVEN